MIDRRAAEIFNDALDVDSDERDAFVRDACGDDDVLRAEIASLLDAWRGHEDFLEVADGALARRADRLGPYRLLDEIGRGGQGVVYRAEDVRAGTAEPLAVKVLSPAFAARAGSGERLVREVEAANRLDHEGVCPVVDSGAVNGVPFLVMPYLEGVTLAERLAEGPIAAREVVPIVRDVARTLHHAHEAGLVHRDVKPANVMVRADGAPVLLDFGLVRDTERGASAVTEAGDVLGTPDFMAPELIRGERPGDAQSDVYALGVTLYEALGGRRPFEGPTREAVFRAVLAGGPRRLDRDVPGVGAALATVVDTALEHDRHRRYRTARDLADDLDRILEGRPIRAAPAGVLRQLRRIVRRHPVGATVSVAFVALVTVALVLSLLAVKRIDRELEHSRALGLVGASAEVGRTDPMLGLLLAREAVLLERSPETVSRLQAALASLHESATLFRHDARLMAVHQVSSGVMTLSDDVIRRSWDEDLEGFVTSRRSVAPFPDGSGFVMTDRSRRAVIHGGRFPVTCRAHSRRVLSVSTDGERVLSTSHDGTALLHDRAGRLLGAMEGHPGPVHCGALHAATGLVATAVRGEVRLWDGDGAPRSVLDVDEGFVHTLIFSRNGKRLYTADRARVGIWNTETGERVATVDDHPDFIFDVALSPDDRHLAIASADHTITLWTGEGRPVARLVGHDAGVHSVAFSHDGAWIVSGSYDQTARVWDMQGRETLVLRGHGATVVDAIFTADGKHVITASEDGTARRWDLRHPAMPVYRGHAHALYSAIWSPDGDSLLTASRDGTATLWRLDGTRVATLRGHEGMIFSARFLRDGRHVVTTGYDQTIRVWDPNTGDELIERRQTREDGRFLDTVDPTPAGRRLARHRTRNVQILDVDGEEIARLRGHTATVWSASFSPDGRTIATAGADGLAAVWRDDGTHAATLEGHAGGVRHAAFDAAGGRVVTSSDDGTARIWTREGTHLHTLEGHQGEVLHGAFSPDGRHVVTASRDRTARIWDATTGSLVMVLRGHEGVVWSAHYSRDGRQVLTASSDRTARTWLVETESLLELAAERAREMTEQERARFAGLLGR